MKNRRIRNLFALAVSLVYASSFIACSSAPTKEELTSLEDLRAEIRSLEQMQSALQQKRSVLAASITAKETQLKEIEAKKTELLKYN